MSEDSCSDSDRVFVAVHAGAGNHSRTNEDVYKSVCHRACQQAMLLLRSKASALEAVLAAVTELEDAPCTNAGTGSTLTFDGTVECDACVMDGEEAVFGAVGALSGVKNPVAVAKSLVDEQKLGPLPGGRVRPSILVGVGAQTYSRERGYHTSHCLTSESTLKTYRRYKRKCQRAERKRKCETAEEMSGNWEGAKVVRSETWGVGEDKPSLCGADSRLEEIEVDNDGDHTTFDTFEANRIKVTCEDRSGIETKSTSHDIASTFCPILPGVQDTVGAVCVDWRGGMAAGSSSGGIWLKHPGRLGPAAVYGAGCWAQNQTGVKAGVASVTSGCGEHLMQTLLAKTCCDAVRQSDDMSRSLSRVFTSDFLESEFLSSKCVKHGGALVMRQAQDEEERGVELSWIHSTSSMCLAYMSGSDRAPRAVVSRLDEASTAGKSFSMGGHFTQM